MSSRLLLAVVLCALGCGGDAVSQPEPKVAATEPTSATGEALPVPAGSLRRSDVRQALSSGLGMFLQRVTVDVDHPVFRGSQFVGFRILALNGPGWTGIDLKPGDVVTAVNGFSVERPEQAQQAFLSLAVASEIRVDYERDGQARSLRLGIVDGT